MYRLQDTLYESANNKL